MSDDLEPETDRIASRALDAFRVDRESTPATTLRGGNALDGYHLPPPFDPDLDSPTDAYFESNYWGLAHLDPASWRHYLPDLIAYSLAHRSQPGAMAVDAVLASLRPPDREPPRLGSLTPEQEKVVVAFLDVLAFGTDSAWQAYAMQVMEEYWAPGALYRGEDRNA
jgi:hypothetical protein